MLVHTRDGEEVEIEVGGSYSNDIQIVRAEFVDRGRNVTDEELTWIEHHYAEVIYEEWLDSRISMAEDAMDRWRDGTY